MAAKRTATQLTVTIPDGAPAGSILSIPVNGKAETIKARVPEGLGPGSTLVLTQWEGSEEWTEEPMPVVPGAVVGLDLNRDGHPDLIVAGPDMNGDGIPDVLQQGHLGVQPPLEPDPGLVPPGPVAYTVRLDTSAGVIDIIVRPDWAPHGARRFLELAASGDLDGLSFYRAVKGCLAQFGLPARRQWQPLPDDPPTGVPFLLGAVCFAAVGKNSRKSTLFICIGDMSHCFGQSPWETPIGAVAEASLDVLDRIETIYGDIAECGGAGPNTSRINSEGNEYLRANFPLLTHIVSAKPLDWRLPDGPPAAEPGCSAPAVEVAREPASAVVAPSLGSTSLAVTTVGPSISSTPAQEHLSMGSSAGCLAPGIFPIVNGSGPAPVSTPIDVPVEVVPSVARGSPRIVSGNLTARAGRSAGGSLVLDVPVEVCTSRTAAGGQRRRTLAGSGAKTARSSSRAGIVRGQSSLESSIHMTPSQASSVSFLNESMQPLNSSLNRSLSVSFEQQAQMQAQVLQHAQAQAQAHGQQPQPLRALQPQGQHFASPLGSALLGSCGPLLSPQFPPQSPQQFPPQSPQQFVPQSPGAFAAAAAATAAQLQPPMSPLAVLPGLSAPQPLSIWPQR